MKPRPCGCCAATGVPTCSSPPITPGAPSPAAWAGLACPPANLDRHIAWDIGIAGVTERLSAAPGCDRGAADLFAAGDRLQPQSVRAKFNSGNQRVHPDPRQPRSYARTAQCTRRPRYSRPITRASARCSMHARPHQGARSTSPCTASRRCSRANHAPCRSACCTTAMPASPASCSICCARKATSWLAITPHTR